jgi:exopolysaccharide biosynthesis polyprenyl glycosylphosphotransferase
MVDQAVNAEAMGAAEGFTLTNSLSRRTASRWRFVAFVQALDFLVFFAVGLVWLRTLAQDTANRWWPLHVVVALLIATTVHCVFQCCRVYDFRLLTRGCDSTFRAFCAAMMSCGPFLVPLLIQPDIHNGPAAQAGELVAASLTALALLRLAVARLATVLQQSGVVGNRIYIIANSTRSAALLKAELERQPDNRVRGTWILPEQDIPAEDALAGALNFLRVHPVDAVILKLPLCRPDRLRDAARILRTLPRTVLLAPSLDGDDDIVLNPGAPGSERADGLGNLVLVKLSDRPLAGWRWVIKDVQDRLLALVLLAIASPAMLMIVIVIKLSDPGPVFFRQKRFGYGGDTFDIIKFRTMRTVAENQDARALRLTTRSDPRVFPAGRILRRTSLDELPQLLNVLRGDMWIIGPRPHSPYATAGGMIYAQAVQGYAARYRIKPGITGWAQVRGWRGPTETLEQLTNRVEHDLYYIENWSPLFDARILLKTLTCVFGHANAF